MTNNQLNRERLEIIKSWRETYGAGSNVMLPAEEAEELARMALAAMDSEPVALQPELAKVIYHFRDWNEGFPVERFKADYVISWMLANYPPAQPAPVVPEKCPAEIRDLISSHTDALFNDHDAQEIWNACRSAMLQASPVCTCPSGDGSLRWPCPVHAGNSPAQSDCCPAQNSVAPAQGGNSPVIPESCSAQFGNFQHYWHSKGYVMVPKEPTEAMCDISHIGVDVYCGITDDNEYYSIGGADAAKVWKAMLAAAPQEVK
ncbi:hypothetical protein ACXDGJ_002956 [Klebsiella pneumoniae]